MIKRFVGKTLLYTATIGAGAAIGIGSVRVGEWALLHGWDRLMNPSARRP